jgi:hypothetical protein
METILLNDLLSQFDTLHDFLSLLGDKNKDKSLDKNGKCYEFANIFKPKLLNAMEKEPKINKLISKKPYN